MRVVRWTLLLVALAGAASWTARLGVADSGTLRFPLKKGSVWTYAVTYSLTGRAQSAQVRVVRASASGSWTLQWKDHAVEATVSPNGVLLKEERHVGAAGLPRIVPMADLRWGGAAEWKTETISGCSPYTIQGKRDGRETVIVPAGHFDCIKIVNQGLGTDTFWVADGVGIVKWSQKAGRSTEEWVLQRYQE